MRFVGIDIGAETHMVAAVDAADHVLIKPTKIAEDAAGYGRLFDQLGDPAETLISAAGQKSLDLGTAGRSRRWNH